MDFEGICAVIEIAYLVSWIALIHFLQASQSGVQIARPKQMQSAPARAESTASGKSSLVMVTWMSSERAL